MDDDENMSFAGVGGAGEEVGGFLEEGPRAGTIEEMGPGRCGFCDDCYIVGCIRCTAQE